MAIEAGSEEIAMFITVPVKFQLFIVGFATRAVANVCVLSHMSVQGTEEGAVKVKSTKLLLKIVQVSVPVSV